MATCLTNRPVDTAVLEYQRQTVELEKRNSELTERLNRYDSTVRDSITELEFISQRAGRAEATVDEVIRLFEQYQREVERLIRGIGPLAPSAKDGNEVDRPVRNNNPN
jgi:prefoldin subunit 5